MAQSEQEFHLCSLASEGRLSITHIPLLDGDQSVFLCDEGNLALSRDHDAPAVVRYPLGFEVEQARVAWPDYDEFESEDERPGHQCCFLDSTHALVSSSEGRLFLLDVAAMEFSAEIQIEGHAPVPLSVKYPTLEAPGFGSDLVAFGRCGHCVIAFFAESHLSPAPHYVVLPIFALLGAEAPRESPK